MVTVRWRENKSGLNGPPSVVWPSVVSLTVRVNMGSLSLSHAKQRRAIQPFSRSLNTNLRSRKPWLRLSGSSFFPLLAKIRESIDYRQEGNHNCEGPQQAIPVMARSTMNRDPEDPRYRSSKVQMLGCVRCKIVRERYTRNLKLGVVWLSIV